MYTLYWIMQRRRGAGVVDDHPCGYYLYPAETYQNGEPKARRKVRNHGVEYEIGHGIGEMSNQFPRDCMYPERWELP